MRGRPCSCAFTGHRPGKLPWGEDESDLRCIALKAKLRAAVESAIHEGMEHFICGMAEGCDLYFAETVLALKSTYPHITLEAAIPCPSQADGWGEAQKSRYRDILARCDYETMVQQSYTPGCMQRRNRYMVDHASLLIAVNDGARGGTRSTIEYAFKRGVNVLDISQTVLQEYFTMIMLVDASQCTVPFADLARALDEAGAQRSLQIRAQREDIFNAMHRI